MGKIVRRMVALFLTIGLCLSLLWAQKKHAALVCQEIAIVIKDHAGQSLIRSKEIIDLLQSTHTISLQKTLLKNIDAYAIQQQLKSHPLVKKVLVYKTWRGTLTIWLATKCLIARIVRPLSNPNDIPCYLDEQGGLIAAKGLPLLRLLVVTDDHIVAAHKRLYDHDLLVLLQYIYQDPFWRGQITSLQVDATGKIILGTQVGGHQVIFGKAARIEEKFEKLWLFYSQVIPYKGWKAYRCVNVAFEGQLICT
ncbi:hypothetical protein [Cardinium endosymbiont of Philonthus spinipes]|uniref:cell division protein FtsQ/DivIB n=1 Tax=Cardinium endosymbiont of Philonthus spinipes TaxID=3077941 RepID=UPI00313E2DE2